MNYVGGALIGLGLIVSLSFVMDPVRKNEKLQGKDFALRVSLPLFVGTLLVMIGYFLLYRASTDEDLLRFLSMLVLLGALTISLTSMFLSVLRLRYAAD